MKFFLAVNEKKDIHSIYSPFGRQQKVERERERETRGYKICKEANVRSGSGELVTRYIIALTRGVEDSNNNERHCKIKRDGASLRRINVARIVPIKNPIKGGGVEEGEHQASKSVKI